MGLFINSAVLNAIDAVRSHYGIAGAVDSIKANIVPPQNNNSAISYAAPSTSPQKLEYFDAPLAERYGMSAETAYQEALANSAYQRKVEDLKKAGLNPVLGLQGSGAAVFAGDSMTSARGSSGAGSSSDKYAGLPLIVDGLVSIAFGAQAGKAAGNVAKGLAQSGVLEKLLG